jgi:hypothetical protein
MRRRAARVALVHRHPIPEVDDCHGYIELRRSASGRCAVWARKLSGANVGVRHGSTAWKKSSGLTRPFQVLAALSEHAEFLGIEFQLKDAVPLIASIDWLTAAVLADQAGLGLPRLPSAAGLLEQRALRPLGRVLVGVEWGDDMHQIHMSLEQWVRILGGAEWTVDRSYRYEGERFTGTWTFDGRRGLEVTYDDGGVGWEGEIDDMDLLTGPQVDGVDLARLALSAAPPA